MEAAYDALVLQLLDEKAPIQMRVSEGDTLDDLLHRFVNRTDEFASDWMRIDGTKFVRYDRVIGIHVLRGHHDPEGMVGV